MKYVLDTNILIYFFKGVGKVSDHLLAKPPNVIWIPTIVLFELEVGIGKSRSPKKRREQLNEFLSLVNIIPFGKDEAICASDIRITLERKGFPIGPYDVLIAGSALAAKATLVTHNMKEFSRVEALKIEDWY
ncbi:MAG: type II toxin-antitoxin system VapC family toxin [Deltaproteobacteria bacterium]|nr:MAG: type II toxin-antitoxin system VapC family toxin [Deltaproteobacteria bacterium]